MIKFNAMFPVMVANDLSALKQFYETHFGFNTVFFEADFYLHLVSPDTSVQLGFLIPDHEVQPDFLHKPMSTDGYVISLEVDDATQAYEEAKKMGLTIAMELRNEGWGQLHFMVEDPAGLRVDIVEQLEVAGN